MRHLKLTENEPARQFQLSANEAEALAAAELAVVSRVPGSSSWDVAAGRKVGVARVGDLQVVVRPKIPIERLVFLMGYTQKPQFWRDVPVLLDPEADLASALADSFVRRTRKALEQGLLHGYVEISDALPLVRGRIRVGDQLARRHGTLLPVEVTYDEFSADIAENQLLLAATLRLLRMPALSPSIRQGLQRIRLQLADVSTIGRGPLPTVLAPDATEYPIPASGRPGGTHPRWGLVRAACRKPLRQRLRLRHVENLRGLRLRRTARGDEAIWRTCFAAAPPAP